MRAVDIIALCVVQGTKGLPPVGLDNIRQSLRFSEPPANIQNIVQQQQLAQSQQQQHPQPIATQSQYPNLAAVSSRDTRSQQPPAASAFKPMVTTASAAEERNDRLAEQNRAELQRQLEKMDRQREEAERKLQRLVQLQAEEQQRAAQVRMKCTL